MKFIVDANIPKSLVRYLVSEGFDIVDIRDFLPPDASDDAVYAEALRQKRTIISRDKHFGNILFYPPQEHFGVILIRTKGLDSEGMAKALLRFLRETAQTNYQGTLYILENRKYRIRKSE